MVLVVLVVAMVECLVEVTRLLKGIMQHGNVKHIPPLPG
jgi:hypothetical protein